MTTAELKLTLRTKTNEYEGLLDSGCPKEELIAVYKELKILQYQLIEAEIKEKETKDLDLA
jgi:hypothetical protein